MITSRGKPVTRTFSSSTSTAPTGGQRQGISEPSQVGGAVAPRPLGLISLIGQTITVGNAEYVLVSLELWSDFFTLRFAIKGITWASRPTPMWFASDDAGVVYRQSSGGHHGSDQLITGEQRFEPALSPATRSLHLQGRVGAESVEADLALDERLPRAHDPSP